MTEEKVWELWDNMMKHVTIPPHLEAYLQGENNDPDQSVNGKSTNSYYFGYPPALVSELDGESAEVARRMLRVISVLRRRGPIEYYGWYDDTKICARIGYRFDDLLKAGYYKNSGNYGGVNTYSLAQLLLELYPEDALHYAQGLLASESGLKELIHARKSDRQIYLMLDIACFLLLQDREKYGAFLPVLEQCAQSFGGDQMMVMLFHGYVLSDVLKEILKKAILADISVSRLIALECLPSGSYPDFLKTLELPCYPYYVLAAIEMIHVSNKPKFFKELLEQDRETFMQAYQQAAAAPEYTYAVHALGLLALLLNRQEGRQELEDLHLRLIAFPGMMNSYFGKNFDLVKQFLMDKTTPLETMAKNLHFVTNVHPRYGQASIMLPYYAALYDFSPVAKKLFDLFIASAAEQNHVCNLAGFLDCFLTGRKDWLDIPPLESAKKLLDGSITYRQLFAVYCLNESDAYTRREAITDALLVSLLAGHEQEALDYLREEDGRTVNGTVAWISLLFDKCGLADYALLLDLLKNKSKLIRKKCEELIGSHEEEIRPLLEERMTKYKGEAAQIARRLIKLWDNERKFGKDFAFTSKEMVQEFCEENYNAENQKSISWIPEDMLCDVRYADLSEKAPPIVIKYILVEYLSLDTPFRILSCDKVVERLHPQDFQTALENIYRLWLDAGADTKKKNLMVAYCLYAADSQIIRLKKQIEEWAGASRGALGAFVVNALALNGGSVALMMVDGMATKFPNNQVKNAARAAFSFAAKALEIPEDELSDRIVPNLGFNRQGEKVLDYGPRTFTVSLLPDFTLSIMDNEKGKAVKSLPKPGAKDHPVKAEAAKKEFSELKKQMKAVVQSQTGRLEKVLMNGRCWTVERWNTLFVENPIMHRFATGLVWGVYEDGAPVQTFRYMDDGTFNTVDEEEYALPENARITLVHPIDLDEETLEAWKQQLEDYEVVQPLPQFAQKPVTLVDGDLEGKLVRRYDKKQAPVGKISGVAKKYNMIRGDVLDGGSYTCYHLVDKYLGVGAQLNFEWMYMGQDFDEQVPLEKLVFYRLPEDGVLDDEIKDNLVLDPKAVAPRFVSSVLSIFDGMLAHAQEN